MEWEESHLGGCRTEKNSLIDGLWFTNLKRSDRERFPIRIKFYWLLIQLTLKSDYLAVVWFQRRHADRPAFTC